MSQKATLAESNDAKVMKVVQYMLRTKLRPMEAEKSSGEVHFTIGISNGGVCRLIIGTSEVHRDGAK